jgi:HPt (histidine-containing phosphotransfer) domain-containing protein
MAIDRRPIDQMVLDVGMPAFLTLAALFHEETHQAVGEIRRLLVAPDWRELGRQAHSLKHSAASFGLVELATIATRLEAAADAERGAAAAHQVTALAARADSDLAELDLLLADLAAAGSPR